MGWLLSLGPAIAGEAMANAVDRLALGPNLANWLTYGLVGLALDRAILGVVDRLPQPEKEPPPEIDLSPQAHWVWTGAGIALALIGLELIGRLTDGPQPSQALIDLLHGLGSRAAGGFEFIVVTRKQEWLGALAGMLVAAAGLALGLRALRTYPHSHPAAKVLKLLAGFGLFAGAVSIALPAGLFAQIGPFFLSQLLTLLIPLGAYLIHLSDQSPGDLTRGSLLLAWILVGGWLPLLGWSTIGDRMYILTAFLNGEGLPGVLLGQALISTLLGGLLWLHRDRWLRSTS
jgi:hypothetical protein